MANKRIFTDEELKAMSGTTLDKAFAAIDSGDKEKAKKLTVQAQKEYQKLHDGYMVWVSGLLSYIYKNHGIGSLEESERFAHTVEAKLVFKPPEKTDFKSVAEHRLKGLKGHMQPVTVEEDDEGKNNPDGRLRSWFSQGQRGSSYHLGKERLPHILLPLSDRRTVDFR